jgi:hypothetical protein
MCFYIFVSISMWSKYGIFHKSNVLLSRRKRRGGGEGEGGHRET